MFLQLLALIRLQLQLRFALEFRLAYRRLQIAYARLRFVELLFEHDVLRVGILVGDDRIELALQIRRVFDKSVVFLLHFGKLSVAVEKLLFEIASVALGIGELIVELCYIRIERVYLRLDLSVFFFRGALGVRRAALVALRVRLIFYRVYLRELRRLCLRLSLRLCVHLRRLRRRRRRLRRLTLLRQIQVRVSAIRRRASRGSVVAHSGLSRRILLHCRRTRRRRISHGCLTRRGLSRRALTRYYVLGLKPRRRRLFELFVVLRALLRIGQNVVRLVDVRESVGSGRITRIHIGVITLSEYTIAALYILVGSRRSHIQNLIVVFQSMLRDYIAYTLKLYQNGYCLSTIYSQSAINMLNSPEQNFSASYRQRQQHGIEHEPRFAVVCALVYKSRALRREYHKIGQRRAEFGKLGTKRFRGACKVAIFVGDYARSARKHDPLAAERLYLLGERVRKYSAAVGRNNALQRKIAVEDYRIGLVFIAIEYLVYVRLRLTARQYTHGSRLAQVQHYAQRGAHSHTRAELKSDVAAHNRFIHAERRAVLAEQPFRFGLRVALGYNVG